MLRSHRQQEWHIGTAPIRANHHAATGLRFVNWQHFANDDDARADPPPVPTIQTYNYIEKWLPRSPEDCDATLVLTTTRNSAIALQAHFQAKGKQANAETAVKVAGATARHCIVLHGRTNFLSRSRRSDDFDSVCHTRANVAYSRATDLTVLACPVNMQGIPGALQVIAALLHGVCTLRTGKTPQLEVTGQFDATATYVSEATSAFADALEPHELWTGSLPVCLVEYHEGQAKRLVLTSLFLPSC